MRKPLIHMKIITDLDFIKKEGQIKEEENMSFRIFLKYQDEEYVDSIVHDTYKKVVENIDCTECANCCKVFETSFFKEELDLVIRELNINKEEFIEKETKNNEDDPDQIVLKSTPCMFLKNNKCTIYDLRPEECNSYPHLHKDDFTSRLFGVVGNYEFCPIVYNVYEQLKQSFNFKY